MPKTRVQKTQAVSALSRAFKGGKAAVFTDYQGMTVAKLTRLRKELKASEVEYTVAKKSLLSLAAKQAGFDINFKSLAGMVGVAFAQGDEMAPAKIIGDASKDASIKFLGGIFEGKIVDAPFITALSKLPSKSQLLGQLLSVMNGPIAAFVRLLDAQRKKLEAGT